jgi:hypothetical protein
MDFADVEKSISFYGKKAKDGQLALEDMTGIYVHVYILICINIYVYSNVYMFIHPCLYM